MVNITLTDDIPGEVLDLGGGGEGVIGRLCGARVTAIDLRPEELAEAPGDFRRLVMDARALAFPDARFDSVTAFYFLMYVARGDRARVLAEAARVLRPGGRLYVWDAQIETARPFLAELDIALPGGNIRTTYGVWDSDPALDLAGVAALGRAAGLAAEQAVAADGHFHIIFRKPEAGA